MNHHWNVYLPFPLAASPGMGENHWRNCDETNAHLAALLFSVPSLETFSYLCLETARRPAEELFRCTLTASLTFAERWSHVRPDVVVRGHEGTRFRVPLPFHIMWIIPRVATGQDNLASRSNYSLCLTFQPMPKDEILARQEKWLGSSKK